jgi:hypothetical protein
MGNKVKTILKPFYVIIKIISISVIFNTILLAQAPDTLWTKTFGEGVGNSVQQTTDGGYIVAGEKDWDVLLIKTDALGDTLWTKTIEGRRYDRANSIQQTVDGGYIVVGTTRPFAGNDDVWLIKTNALGDTLWTKTFGGGGGNSVQQTADGGYIVAGGSDHWLIKTDVSGDTLWTKTFGEGEGNSVQQTTDGGYIVAGEKNDDILLRKTDASGDTLWTKNFEGSGLSVQQTTDGGYLVAGTNYDVLLIKIAPDLTNIQKKETKLVTHYSLSQNYPNPFNPTTAINFTLPHSEFTTLTVYNILGKEVSTLVSKKLNQGNHTFTFDGKHLASGIYYYQLTAGDYREVNKMILLK